MVLCDQSILIFQNCIDAGTLPDTWKKLNIVPALKKGNYYKNIWQLQISFSSTYTLKNLWKKMFSITFNSIFEYLQQNNLLCLNQSSFRHLNFCKYQLLSIVCEIHKSFDSNPPKDVMGIFLDISKAFKIECGMMSLQGS